MFMLSIIMPFLILHSWDLDVLFPLYRWELPRANVSSPASPLKADHFLSDLSVHDPLMSSLDFTTY